MTDTAPDTGTTTTDSTTTSTTNGAGDHVAEIEKWRSLARKHEDRAKENSSAAKELEQLRAQSMTDQEKAVAAARLDARAEALREVGTKLVDAEVRAATAGRNVDAEALLEGLDRSKFVGADGDPDREAIVAWVDRVAPRQEPGTERVDLGQGVRPGQNMALNGDPLLRDLKAKLGIR